MHKVDMSQNRDSSPDEMCFYEKAVDLVTAKSWLIGRSKIAQNRSISVRPALLPQRNIFNAYSPYIPGLHDVQPAQCLNVADT